MRFDLINIVHVLIIWQSKLFAIVLITLKYNKLKSKPIFASKGAQNEIIK